MGFKSLDIKIHTAYQDDELRQIIRKKLDINSFSFQVENKSLDARNKRNIHWILKVAVYSEELSEQRPDTEDLEIPYTRRNKSVSIIGSGPAGFFAAFTLQKAGFDCTLLERGKEVNDRASAIRDFEQGKHFDPNGNYAFGEGGAGTFSDGKLTSRSKHISKEKAYITQCYIDAGAPAEIAYMKHPHLGTDNLRRIVKRLRESFIRMGGKVHFETCFTDLLNSTPGNICIETNKGQIESDYLVIAPGHSANDTYKMLMHRGLPFRTKNFAIGSRAEHQQEIINTAQWGVKQLEGVKAAEYRLTAKMKDGQPVYSFCMCPGGVVVPAAAFADQNIVNGMSYFSRNGNFANAAYVAGIHPDQLLGKTAKPVEALDALEDLERSFFRYNQSYEAPFCSIQDFTKERITKKIPQSTYPLGLAPAPLWELLPKAVVPAMQKGLHDFSRKLKGYQNGILLGLESKTSSPVQVLRDRSGRVEGFENIYMVGEGSGYAGGIMSSAADGVKAAMHIIEHEQ